VTDVAGRRRFACTPAAVLAYIVDERKPLLLLAFPEMRNAPRR
jgi:hypothetical protein